MSFDKHKLTALYGSGQLSDDERKQLFAAALEDQELFDALAHEDSIRDALLLPGARERVIADLKPKRSRWFAWAGGLAVAAAAAVVFVVVRPQTQPVTVPPSAEVQSPQVKTNAPMEAEVRNEEPTLPKQAKAKQAEAPRQMQSPQKAPPGAVAPAIAPLEASKKEGVELKDKALQPEDQKITVTASSSTLQAERSMVGGSLGASNRAAPQARRASSPLPAYSVLRKNSDGAFVPLPSGEALKRGDIVRIAITAPMNGRMIVASAPNAIQDIQAGERYLIPAIGEIVLDGTAGELTLRGSFQPTNQAGAVMKLREQGAGVAGGGAPPLPSNGPAPIPIPFEIKLTYK